MKSFDSRYSAYHRYPTIAFDRLVEQRLEIYSRNFTPGHLKSTVVANELGCIVEDGVGTHDPRVSERLNLPGESAWRIVLRDSLYGMNFEVEVIYTLSATYINLPYVKDPWVPDITVYFINLKVLPTWRRGDWWTRVAA